MLGRHPFREPIRKPGLSYKCYEAENQERLPEFIADALLADGLADALALPSKPPAVRWEDVLSPVDWGLWREFLGSEKREKAA